MKILFLSDFLPDENVVLSESFDRCMHEADAVVFNLEGSPLLPKENDNVKIQIMPFQIENLVNFLEKYGLHKFHLALANNHILDNRLAGFDYLIKILTQHNINYFGTKDKPFIHIKDVSVLNLVTAETVAKKGISESRLNYLFYDTARINKQIAYLEDKGDKLVFYPHWGRDMDTAVFTTYDHKLIFRKKWKTFGHHPHVISGIKEDFIYSLGNNYIPHPYYFQSYPATHYGLAVLLDSEDMKYELLTTQQVKKNDKFVLNIELFSGIHEDVLQHGKKFSFIKKTFLKLLSFKGNFTDFFKLIILQMLTFIFALKYRITKN